MDKLDYLIKYLLEENKNIDIEEIPKDLKEKQKLYRSLCNVRDAMPISEKYLEVENEYLQEEIKKRDIVDLKGISSSIVDGSTKISLWKGDITLLKIDCIVNAANSQGLGCFIPCHKCIDNIIHSTAGVQLRIACNEKMKNIGILKTGEVFLTKGYNLPARFVIHTVGPIIHNVVTKKKKAELEKCYINSLKIAKDAGIKNIAFCCISTGEFRFPKDLASEIAVKAVKKFLKQNEDFFETIIFDVFSDEDYDIYLEKLGDVYGI